jgi:hypothetical protein
MPGTINGRSTRVSVVTTEAPSTFAASVSSFGVCIKVLRIR